MENTTVNKDKTTFITFLILLIVGILASIASLLIFINRSGMEVYIFLTRALVLSTILICSVLAFVVLQLIQIFNGKKPLIGSLNFLDKSLKIIYPFMIFISNILKLDKDPIRRVFSQINNKIVILKGTTLNPSDILILAPHCLQNSSCKIKVTGNIDNCNRCGKCNINDLINIKELYKANVEIVTGGTLARKLIVDHKPLGIIAIACERDLSSGLLDIKSIPVIGITNIRPEGPCRNTCFDVNEVHRAINTFSGR